MSPWAFYLDTHTLTRRWRGLHLPTGKDNIKNRNTEAKDQQRPSGSPCPTARGQAGRQQSPRLTLAPLVTGAQEVVGGPTCRATVS